MAVRLGELIEQVETDDWLLDGGEPLGGLGGAGGGQRSSSMVPSWCRAAFMLRDQWDQLQAGAWPGGRRPGGDAGGGGW